MYCDYYAHGTVRLPRNFNEFSGLSKDNPEAYDIFGLVETEN